MTDISGYTAMRAGEFYKGPDAYLLELQIAAAERLAELNAIPSFDMARRVPLLKQLLGSFGVIAKDRHRDHFGLISREPTETEGRR